MKKNTKFWHIAVMVTFIISGIFNAVGVISDLFGFAEGISGHSSIIRSVLAFVSARWRWTMGFTVLLLAVILFFKWKRKKELEEMESRKLSWFDADRRITSYTGGMDNLIQLKKFLQTRDDVFSWWAVTGVAGMGKTRLAIEALRLDEFRNVDVKWIKDFEDYREENLKGLVDSILESGNFRNILIADDAQIYMDNVGLLIEYIYKKNAVEMGDHKIRLLLLLRMGEDEDLRDRYKQLSSKAAQSTLRATLFSLYDKELRIEKYSEDDVTEIVKSYAMVTAKKRYNRTMTEEQLSEILKKTVGTLKSDKVDPYHMRPLFAMFIADALLAGQEPMSWSRSDILEYAAGKREDELLMWETKDVGAVLSGRIFDKVRGIVSLSIIRNGIEISELEGIKDDLKEELNLAGISLKDFFKEIQLLDKGDIIRVHMPDILSEYYVLRTLVIEPEDDDEVIRWVISRLVSNMDGVAEFRRKVRQDFRYIYDDKLNANTTIEDKLDDFYYRFFEKCNADVTYGIIKKLLNQLSLDLRDSNMVILHEAIQKLIREDKNVNKVATALVFGIFQSELEIEEARLCLDELRQIAEENPGDEKIMSTYCNGLYIMRNNAPDLQEKRLYLEELKHITQLNTRNSQIVLFYCQGLFNTQHDALDLEEKRACLAELKRYADANTKNSKIVLAYCSGLVKMQHDTTDLEESRACLAELKRYADTNAGNAEILLEYSTGLFNMCNDKYDMEERSACMAELKQYADSCMGNEKIVLMYCYGLVNMLHDVPDLEVKRSYLAELQQYADEYVGNAEILLEYNSGLLNMTIFEPDLEEKRECLAKIEHYANANVENAKIVHTYSRGLFNMLIYSPDLEQKRSWLNKLRQLAELNAGNANIMLEYCRGLVNLYEIDGERHENYITVLYKLLSDKKFARYVAKEVPDIITYTRRELLAYEQGMGIIGNAMFDLQ